MKLLKKLFNFILLIFALLCGGVLLCAFNPSITNSLAQKVAALQSDSAGEPGIVGTISVNPGADDGDNADEGGDVGSGDLSGQLPLGVADTTDDYVAPSQENVEAPASVQGRNGYEPIHEENEQIEDEDAERLKEDLSEGDTGEQYQFDSIYYPYYAMLSDAKKNLYRQIYANALENITSFAPVESLNVNAVKEVFEAVYNDHPELFWVETGYQCKYQRDGKCVEITMQYYDIAGQLADAKERFESAAESILSTARTLGSDEEKETYVHDALIRLVDYSESASMSQSAYSALVNGRSVCAGYARAFQYLMMELEIPCYYCTGYSGENHAWDIVKLGDTYYNVDVTWDDTEPSTYDFFNKSDADYAKTHMRTGLSVKLPACLLTETEPTSEEASGEEPDEESTEEPVENLINENPTEPLSWVGSGSTDDSQDLEPMSPEREKLLKTLYELGLTEEDILDTMEKYYADCLKQMTAAGTGQQQFRNVIPKALWATVEQSYGDRSYQKGYLDEALKQLGVDNYTIQIQAERLNGGYYRLYHNIYTW